MRFLALLKPAPGTSPQDFAPLIVDEERALWPMYRDGVLREMHFDSAKLLATLVFEVDAQTDVEAALHALPMVRAGLFHVELVRQGAWTPLEALFRADAAEESAAVAVVRGIYDAVARSDWDGVLARLHADVLCEQSSALPFAGVWRGHDGFQRMGAAIFRAWPNFTVEPLAFAQAGDVVLVLTRVKGGDPAAAAVLDQTMIEFWKVEGAQATECRPFYFDPVIAAQSAA
ncbi:MAG: hypothetical protein GC206_15600 [Alphaproteobacteria bacterium]|nr:hypothetical protein [Alphaproteobacteria bacterium]